MAIGAAFATVPAADWLIEAMRSAKLPFMPQTRPVVSSQLPLLAVRIASIEACGRKLVQLLTSWPPARKYAFVNKLPAQLVARAICSLNSG